MIINLTRGLMTVKINDRIAEIEGELCLPEDTDFEFVVYLSSIKKWKNPYDSLEITELEKEEIIEDIKEEIKKTNGRVVFE